VRLVRACSRAPCDGGDDLVSHRAGFKDDETQADSNVCHAFAYLKEKVYLSLTGKASTNRDPARARSLWNDEQKVWWPGGPDDPNLLVIRFKPDRAELWDGPASSTVAAVEFAKSSLTGTMPDLGENRKVTLEIG